MEPVACLLLHLGQSSIWFNCACINILFFNIELSQPLHILSNLSVVHSLWISPWNFDSFNLISFLFNLNFKKKKKKIKNVSGIFLNSTLETFFNQSKICSCEYAWINYTTHSDIIKKLFLSSKLFECFFMSLFCNLC